MMTDFTQLLKKVSEGDKPAWEQLKKFFVEKALSPAEQAQVFSYIKNASKTNVYALYVLGLLHDLGLGTRQDYEMAYIVMREGAAHGYSVAIFEVGRRFLLGIGIEANYQNALQWLTLAASSPHYHPAAMYFVGLMYEKGLGVKQDSVQAKKWMEKAAAKGYRI
jgi:TPR repeat protein